MRTHSSWTLLLVSALAIPTPFGFGQAAAAQQSPASSAPAQSSAVLHVTANLVLVDVVVTEKGKAVHGLDRSKFHLFEDGREQTIVNFDEHRPAAVPAALPALPVLPPHTYNNVPAYPATGVVNVLLLDGLNTPATDQIRARQQMIEYLGKIEPGTMLAVFTLSSRLRMATGFTTDVAQLTKAIKDQRTEPGNSPLLAGPTAPDVADQLDARFLQRSPKQFQPQSVNMGTAGMDQFLADIAYHVLEERVYMTLDALKQLGLYLNAIPGRKNLIWFSGSFPAALDPDGSLGDPFRDLADYSAEVRRTNDVLTAARVAVYPVDARGIMTLQPFQASNMTSGPMDGIRDGILDQTGNNEAFMGRIVSEQTSMRQIAEQTGGEAFINTNGLKEAVASADENGESYYTIAYTPAAKKFDSQFHKIQVRLDASGDKLSYRRGYYADSQDKSPLRGPGSKDLVAAATLQGAPPATQILFLTRVLPAGDPQIGGIKPPEGPAGEMSATMKGPKRRYIVDVQIDPRTLDFVQGPEGRHQAEFDCALIAYNAEGKRLNYADRSFSIAPKADQYKGILASGLPVRLALDLPAGEEFLRIVVHDKTVDHAGSLEIPLMVTAE